MHIQKNLKNNVNPVKSHSRSKKSFNVDNSINKRNTMAYNNQQFIKQGASHQDSTSFTNSQQGQNTYNNPGYSRNSGLGSRQAKPIRNVSPYRRPSNNTQFSHNGLPLKSKSSMRAKNRISQFNPVVFNQMTDPSQGRYTVGQANPQHDFVQRTNSYQSQNYQQSNNSFSNNGARNRNYQQ